MNVFIVTDMEGVSGCTFGSYSGKQDPRSGKQYQDLMLGEINAVVEGCARGGADEIIVGESHPIDLSQLHEKAKLARGIPWQEFPELRDFDAVLFVGQHARTNLARAVMSHTGSDNSITGFWINDQPSGELAYIGGLAGEKGVPVVFLSGDTAACDEARELIGDPVVTVEVEESFGVHAAICLPPAKVHPLLIEAATQAIALKDQINPITFEMPVTFKTEFKYSNIADEYCIIPGVKRLNARTCSYTASTYRQAYMGGMAVLAMVLAEYDI